MRPELIGLIVGGLLPPIFYALVGNFTKSSTDAGIDLANYLLVVGLGVVDVGIGMLFYVDEKTLSVKSGLYAFSTGASWAVGMALFSLVLMKYNMPVSRLVPLHGLTPLITVLLAFLLFAEWKEVDVGRILLGSALIVVGGIIVSRT